MSEWTKTRIKESSYLKGRIGWQGLRASEFLEEGAYLITGTDFRSGKIDWSSCYHVSEARFAEASYIHIRDNDLLITKDGTIGKIALVTNCPEKAVLNSGIFLLRSNRGDYDHGFAYFVLTSDIFDTFLRTHLNGSTINHLYQYVFENFEIPSPPLPTQQKIARILQTVDRAMEKTEALIEKYQQIKAGLMHDLFTRGLWTQEELDRGDHKGLPFEASAKKGQLRPTREEAPHLYQETPIGWIPKAWSSETLELLLAPVSNNLRSGPFGSALLKSELVEDGIPFLGIDNIHVERFVDDFRRFVSENKYRSLIKYSVRPRDVVITIMGTVGRSAIIPEDIGAALSSKHLWTMTFDQKKVFPELICWQLNHASWVKAWFRRETQGGIMDAIQSKTLRTLRLPVPPPEEQKEIKKRHDAISAKLKTESLRLAKLQKQKAGLMHDLLTGKVPVTPDSEEAAAT